jgi:glutathione S-transferase
MTHPNSSLLFLSQRSPFARRIRLAFDRLGLPLITREVQVFEENPEVLALNPLGFVPTLLTGDQEAWFDSSTILEHLHDLHGGIWPDDPKDRIRIRQASALVSGAIQGAVSYFQEIRLHEVPSPSWARDHCETVERTLRSILNSAEGLWLRGNRITQAGWDLAVAMEYLELRMPEVAFHLGHPLILEVLRIARENQAFLGTKPLAQ